MLLKFTLWESGYDKTILGAFAELDPLGSLQTDWTDLSLAATREVIFSDYYHARKPHSCLHYGQLTTSATAPLIVKSSLDFLGAI